MRQRGELNRLRISDCGFESRPLPEQFTQSAVPFIYTFTLKVLYLVFIGC